MTLTEFLTARLDEDEAAARRCHVETALPAAWRWLSDGGQHALDHIARHDPARVLADVDAKRALFEETIRPYLGLNTTMARVAEQSLRLLALPYADHPDYLEEWKP